MVKVWLGLMMAFCIVVVHAEDAGKAKNLAKLRELPSRVTAVRQSLESGFSSANTTDMQEAMQKYNEALKSIILDLGKAYYAKPMTKADVQKLEIALVTRAQFEQNAGNPSGETLGTIASLDTASAVASGLESVIVVMAKSLLEGKSNPPFAEWKKNWDKATSEN